MDYRVRAALTAKWYDQLDENNSTATVLIYDDSGEEMLITVPFYYNRCDTCDGSGSYVNPSIDSGGITQDDWDDWSHEEQDYYFSGGYDICCATCSGSGEVPEPDTEKATPEQMKLVEAKIKENYLYALEREREIRYGY